MAPSLQVQGVRGMARCFSRMLTLFLGQLLTIYRRARYTRVGKEFSPVLAFARIAAACEATGECVLAALAQATSCQQGPCCCHTTAHEAIPAERNESSSTPLYVTHAFQYDLPHTIGRRIDTISGRLQCSLHASWHDVYFVLYARRHKRAPLVRHVDLARYQAILWRL